MGSGTTVSNVRYRHFACWMCHKYKSIKDTGTYPPPSADKGYCPHSLVPRCAYEGVCDTGKMDQDRIKLAVEQLQAAGRDPEGVYLKPGQKIVAVSTIEVAEPLSEEHLAETKELCLAHANASYKVPYRGIGITRREMDELVKMGFLFATRSFDGNSAYYIAKEYRVSA
jgi:hypothetical protein